jgi:N-acetylmuramoyl-L-alanine amidase
MIPCVLILLSILPYKYEITSDDRSISVEAQRVGFQDYVPLKPIADFLNVSYVLDNTTQRLSLSRGDTKLELVAGVSSIVYDGATRNLAFAPQYINGEVYFPVNEVIPTIGGVFGQLIFVREIKEAPKIDDISLVVRGDSTVLVFKWKTMVDFDVQFLMKKAIVEVDGQYKGKITRRGNVTATKVTPFTTYTKVELDLKDVNAFLERDEEVVFYYKVSEKVQLIVIDPGHGGIDPGAVGRKGLYEKDVNLAISKYLYDLLRDSLGITVKMTRDKDEYISLRERTNIANRNSADLFVSIHCNATPKRSTTMKGFETYFLSEARTNEERAVAALENAALQFDGVQPADDVSRILYDLAQSAYLDESNRFAEYIQDYAARTLSIPSRGVKQAGFYVLHGAFMPAVLVECAFISSVEEEKLLGSKSFRKNLAYCIFCGIRDYITDYERRVNN